MYLGSRVVLHRGSHTVVQRGPLICICFKLVLPRCRPPLSNSKGERERGSKGRRNGCNAAIEHSTAWPLAKRPGEGRVKELDGGVRVLARNTGLAPWEFPVMGKTLQLTREGGGEAMDEALRSWTTAAMQREPLSRFRGSTIMMILLIHRGRPPPYSVSLSSVPVQREPLSRSLGTSILHRGRLQPFSVSLSPVTVSGVPHGPPSWPTAAKQPREPLSRSRGTAILQRGRPQPCSVRLSSIPEIPRSCIVADRRHAVRASPPF